MTPEEVQTLIHSYYRPCTAPDARFTSNDVEQIERHFQCSLPPEFQAFRKLLPHYSVEGDHLPFAEIELVYRDECDINPNFTTDYLPFYAVGTGDFICLRISACPDSPVLYIAHDDPEIDTLALSFADYLRDPDWFTHQ
jgi:hypothetical protein